MSHEELVIIVRVLPDVVEFRISPTGD